MKKILMDSFNHISINKYLQRLEQVLFLERDELLQKYLRADETKKIHFLFFNCLSKYYLTIREKVKAYSLN